MACSLHVALNDNMVDMAHQLFGQKLTAGEVALDATCGRGRDTLFLARAVGPDGQVYAFDIQPQALAATEALLAAEGAGQQVSLILADHSRMKEFICRPIQAAVFNLGYLPGGDQQIRTMAKTTLQALSQAMELLKPNGILVVVAYPGHPGGGEERDAVMTLLASLAGNCWRTGHLSLPNKGEAPCLFYAVKIREDAE